MHKIIKYLLFIFCGTLTLTSCQNEYIGQYPTDSTQHKPVSNVRVTNLPGAVELTYSLPDEKDMLYVKATYMKSNGEYAEYKASVFSNNMLLEGFGKSQKTTVRLVSVDKSQNESLPVEVEIEPQDSPIYNIFENLHIEETFGGIRVTWENPLRQEIMVGVLKRSDITGELEYVDNFYSTEHYASNAIRGLDSISADFGVFVRDLHMNYTDTVLVTLTPYYEQEIPKSGFREIPIAPYFAYHRSQANISTLWDLNYTNTSGYNYLYMRPGNDLMPYFTLDLGSKVKISRVRHWQRLNQAFQLHNPRRFEWYGTNDKAVAEDVATLGWEDNPAWTKLMTGESVRPSGLDAGDPITNEDSEYAAAGEDFEFYFDAPAVQYLRFKLVETWGGSDGLFLMELSLWGRVFE